MMSRDYQAFSLGDFGRDDWIRTSDHLNPIHEVRFYETHSASMVQECARVCTEFRPIFAQIYLTVNYPVTSTIKAHRVIRDAVGLFYLYFMLVEGINGKAFY